MAFLLDFQLYDNKTMEIIIVKTDRYKSIAVGFVLQIYAIIIFPNIIKVLTVVFFFVFKDNYLSFFILFSTKLSIEAAFKDEPCIIFGL